MSGRTGIFERPEALPPDINIEDSYPRKAEYVPDIRDGVDRWGRERKRLTACGTGWGPGEYICPAYLEESCPGERNRHVKMLPSITHLCDLDCGGCGGGGRVSTMAYCGWPKGQPMFDAVMKEMGGSLRLDRYTASPARPIEKWPAAFIPSLEWAAKHWIPVLGEEWTGKEGGQYPAIATSIRTASPGRKRDGMPLRDRLGGYEGFLIVHGLAKDDVLDDAWDGHLGGGRKRLFEWNIREGTDLMLTPQFSYYDDAQLCMVPVNVNRIFRWYLESADAGFPYVGLDWPPGPFDWLHNEYVEFAIRSEVKIVALSYQTMNDRGGMKAGHLSYLRTLNKDLPEDVSFLFFGVGNVLGMSQARRMMPNRNLAFLSSEPFARTAFWHLMTNDHAPKRFSKGQVFSWNVKYLANMVAKVEGAAERRRARAATAAASRAPRSLASP